MRWRKRYVCYSFEPYGVAIRLDYARGLGIRPVLYGEAESYNQLLECEKHLFQSRGSAIADWLPEREWRHRGDLSLDTIPREQWRLITFSEKEAEFLRRIVGCQVTPLTI
jgi:hypothetical protein